MGGVPHRTSYELHLPAELPWYSLIELQRTVSGRSAAGRRTLGGRRLGVECAS
jgi:hypothetical protein